MTQRPRFNQKDALTLAMQNPRWLLTALFAACLCIVPSTTSASAGWKMFGWLTSLLFGAATVGQVPFVYMRLSSQKKLLVYGASAIGLLFLGFFWIAGNFLAKNQAENAVIDRLKDPDSARFGAFYMNTKTGKGCLVVNARNSMGGYTGDQVAYFSKTDGQYEVSEVKDDSSFDICTDQANLPPVASASPPSEADVNSAVLAAAAAGSGISTADAAASIADSAALAALAAASAASVAASAAVAPTSTPTP